MASGAPDWQTVVTLVAPSLTHGAPDWERTIVGPGGTPIGGGLSLVGYGHVASGSPVALNGSSGTTILTVSGLTANTNYLFVQFITIKVTMTSAAGWVAVTMDGVELTSGYVVPPTEYAPGCTVSNAYAQLVYSAVGYLVSGTTLTVVGLTDNGGGTTASAVAAGATGGSVFSTVSVWEV